MALVEKVLAVWGPSENPDLELVEFYDPDAYEIVDDGFGEEYYYEVAKVLFRFRPGSTYGAGRCDVLKDGVPYTTITLEHQGQMEADIVKGMRETEYNMVFNLTDITVGANKDAKVVKRVRDGEEVTE